MQRWKTCLPAPETLLGPVWVKKGLSSPFGPQFSGSAKPPAPFTGVALWSSLVAPATGAKDAPSSATTKSAAKNFRIAVSSHEWLPHTRGATRLASIDTPSGPEPAQHSQGALERRPWGVRGRSPDAIIPRMEVRELLREGEAAIAAADWETARAALERVLEQTESAEALIGLSKIAMI